MSFVDKFWNWLKPHIVQDDPYPCELSTEQFPYIFRLPWPVKIEPYTPIGRTAKTDIAQSYENVVIWLKSETNNTFAVSNLMSSAGIFVALSDRNDAMKFRLHWSPAVAELGKEYIAWHLYNSDGDLFNNATTKKIVDTENENKYTNVGG